MSTREKTTVRIPIPVAGEVPEFGVYAVPGLQTHVFVGPFTDRASVRTYSSDDDVICLDSPTKTQGPEDDDEVQVLESTPGATAAAVSAGSSSRRKQKLEVKTEDDGVQSQSAAVALVSDLVHGISDRAVAVGEFKLHRDEKRKQVSIYYFH